MNYKQTEKELTDRLIDLSFAEDVGDGDHTTLCCIPADAMGESELMIKEEGIFAGERAALEVFKRFDPELKVTMHMHDGDHVRPGDIVLSVSGREQSLLTTERLMLNICQRMSGIATMAHRYQQASSTRARRRVCSTLARPLPACACWRRRRCASVAA